MNINLSSFLKPVELAQPLAAAPLELSKSALGSIKTPIDFGPIFDGGQLPGGCFACGLAFSSIFGEQFLSQFFGL